MWVGSRSRSWSRSRSGSRRGVLRGSGSGKLGSTSQTSLLSCLINRSGSRRGSGSSGFEGRDASLHASLALGELRGSSILDISLDNSMGVDGSLRRTSTQEGSASLRPRRELLR